MARRLPGPLIHEFVEVAELLTRQTGPANLRQACMRRAVSSASYAVFHALCFVCADALVGGSRTDVLPPIYRSLDHAVARRRLRSDEARAIDPCVERIGTLFATLQEQRHAADYAPPGSLFSATQTRDLVDDARNAVDLIQALDARARLQLAILLVARQRAT